VRGINTKAPSFAEARKIPVNAGRGLRKAAQKLDAA